MSPHVFTLNVSNVPGPKHPLLLCGRRFAPSYSLAEVADWHALRIAVFSGCGSSTFGLCGDAEHIPSLEHARARIEAEFVALTGSHIRPTRRRYALSGRL